MQSNSIKTTSAPSIEHDRKTIWSILYDAGMLRLNAIQRELQKVAPEPGSAVFIGVRAMSGKALSPVLYYAIDCRTHLQVARLYFIKSAASSVDFLGFVQQAFPFQIRRIITRPDEAFATSSSDENQHRFTLLSSHFGIRHDVCGARESELFDLLAEYVFDALLEGSLDESTERSVQTRLQNFLFFHNHHRSFASLGGKTALQALRVFPGFSSFHIFNPYRRLTHSG